MGLKKFDPALAVHDLIQDLKWSAELRAEFAANEAAVLDRYPLRADERRAIETRNFLALYDIGLHPYLGGQLARLVEGRQVAAQHSLEECAVARGHDSSTGSSRLSADPAAWPAPARRRRCS